MFIKEIDMQKEFINKLNTMTSERELILEEFNARFGNVDVVKTTISDDMNISAKQMNVLTDYQCSKVVAYLHRKKLHTISYLMKNTCYTYENIKSILSRLKSCKIIEEIEREKYIICPNFEFPNIEFTAYELKLKNWKNAMSQAMKNKKFASYSYIVLPIELAKSVFKKNKMIFDLYNVGLIGLSKSEYYVFKKPFVESSKIDRNPTYISSIAKFYLEEKRHYVSA